MIYVICIIAIVAFSVLQERQNMSRINNLQQHRINDAPREKISIATATTTKDSNTTHSFTVPTRHNVSVVVRPVLDLPTKVADPTSATTPPTISPTPHPSPQQRVHRNITLIVQLRGELGNQLSVLANARITQLLARAKYPHIHMHLVGQHQYDTKWTRGRDVLIQCFNAFTDFDFEGGTHNEEFRIVQNLQQAWLNVAERNQLSNVRSFHFLDSLLLQQEQNQNDRHNTTGSSIPQLPSTVSKYSLPYLTASSFSWIDCLRNEGYYNEMRQWLQFNMKECCNSNVRPNDNDIVFHYRNFAHELRSSKLKGQLNFVEIPPHIAANVAFRNHAAVANSRDDTTAAAAANHHNTTPVVHVPNIAITSRFETGTEQYIAAFSAQNITSHYVSGQKSGVEGFCYILQAPNEIFGSYQSTYYRWAALLGNATRSRFYTMELPAWNETAEPTVRTTETIQYHHRTMTIEKYWYTTPRRSW